MNNTDESTFVFRQLFDKDTGSFTYLMFDSSTTEGFIIDPVKEQFDHSLKFIEELRVELKYVIDTHVHADHVISSCMLRDATGAKTANLVCIKSSGMTDWHQASGIFSDGTVKVVQ